MSSLYKRRVRFESFKVRSEHINQMNIVENYPICHDDHERAEIRDGLQRKEAITAGR